MHPGVLLELALRLLEGVLHHVGDGRGRVFVDEVLCGGMGSGYMMDVWLATHFGNIHHITTHGVTRHPPPTT